MVLFNNELRRPIYKSLSAVAFWDTGNTFLRPSDIDPGEFRSTVGLGLRLTTPVGPLRFEYGHKLDRLRGESSGEFVFAIGQSF
jgi:outer membrane protein insertion porin family